MRVGNIRSGWGRGVIGAGALLLVAGCAAGQSGKAKPSGFLGDYAKLRAGAKGEALLVYVDPQAKFATYRALIIDPVTIWRNAETDAIPRSEALALADELYDVVRMTLDDDYEIVKDPRPDALRLRVAITEAEGSWRAMDTLGNRLDADLRAMAPEQPSDATRGFVGKAGIEAEILDATSGTRLAAAVDRRAGERSWKPDKGTWDDVEDAFRYWADRLRERLAELRRRLGGLVAPRRGGGPPVAQSVWQRATSRAREGHPLRNRRLHAPMAMRAAAPAPGRAVRADRTVVRR